MDADSVGRAIRSAGIGLSVAEIDDGVAESARSGARGVLSRNFGRRPSALRELRGRLADSKGVDGGRRIGAAQSMD